MKVLFHDVDGCLNADADTPVPRIGEAMPVKLVAKLKELGRRLDLSSVEHLVINTGRSIEDTLLLVELINSEKLRYVICEHGAVFHDVKQNQPVVPSQAIANKLELIHRFIDWYRETGAVLLNEKIGTEVPILDKVANLTLDSRGELDTNHILSVLQAVIQHQSPFDSQQLVFHHSQVDGYVDVMSQIDKGDGVHAIASLLSLPKESPDAISSIAVGNGLNDLPMLQVATTPVCPANAEPEVIEYCSARSGVVSEREFIDATLQWLESQIPH